MELRPRRVIAAMILTLVLLVGIKVFAIVTEVPQPPLPDLLRGVGAGGGWTSVCSADKQSGVRMPLAWSPELNRRLERDFPPGSDTKRLTDELQRLGFQMAVACREDLSIRSAQFEQHGGFLLRPSGMPMLATIWWKVDSTEQHLIWARGMVSFDAL